MKSIDDIAKAAFEAHEKERRRHPSAAHVQERAWDTLPEIPRLAWLAAMRAALAEASTAGMHYDGVLTQVTAQDAARDAVTWAMHRLQEDARLAYLVGPGSELFDRLTLADALARGISVDVYRRELQASLRIEPLPHIKGPVYAGLVEMNAGVHDLDTASGLSDLLDHVLNKGLQAMRDERDAQTHELF